MPLFIVLGSLIDPHIKRVVGRLESENIPCSVIDHINPLNYSFFVSRHGEPELLIGDQRIVTPFIIWDRVKIIKGTPYYPEEDERIADFKAKEWSAFYRLLTGVYQDRTFNSPKAKLCLIKPYQQMIASSVGLLVPETIVSNNKSEIEKFYDREGELIVKSISASKVLPKPEENNGPYNVMTMKVTKDNILDASEEEFKYSPHFFQPNIKKAYELRVVVIEHHVFAFKIDSQAKTYAQTDWRIGNITLDFEPIELNMDIQSKLAQYLLKMGLFSGSFDLIVDKKGQYWFLECNQDGQWAWLDDICDGKIVQQFSESFKRKIYSCAVA